MPNVRLGRAGGGRPPLPDAERRTVKTPVLWTPAEAEVINEALDATGLTFNEWARPALLTKARKDRNVKTRRPRK